jgi:hypothetical protein
MRELKQSAVGVTDAAPSDCPPGAQLRTGPPVNCYDLPIFADGNRIGQIKFNVGYDHPMVVQVKYADIDCDFQGRGLGVLAYQRLADWTLSTGRELRSDCAVSAQASYVYAALERRGYIVVRDPQIYVNHLGVVQTPGAPAFRIVAGPIA